MKLLKYAGEVIRWLLFDTKSLFPNALLLLFLIWLTSSQSKEVAKIIGFIIQSVGALLVIWSVDSNRRATKGISLKAILSEGMAPFPSFNKKTINIFAAAASTVSSSSSALIQISASRSQSVEERLKIVEELLKTLDSEHLAFKFSTNTKFDEFNNRLTSETHKAQVEHDELRGTIKAIATGSLHIALIGSPYLICGSFLTTF